MVWPFSSSSKSSDAPSQQPAFEAVAPAPVDPTASPSTSSAASSSSIATDDPTAYLRSHAFSQPSSPSAASPAASTSSASASSSDAYVPTATALLSDSSLDLGSLHPLAGLGKDDLEYLDLTDGAPSSMEGARTAVPSRGWSDDLCYGTGTTYLSGLAIGGLLGAREGLSRPLGVDSPTFRLRLNAVLNQVTRRGSFFGNSAGVVALIYNLVDASIDGIRGKHDMLGAVAAGGISGAAFKCTAGPRPMLIASAIMMGAAATWTTAKQALL
ncbi:Tim17-domain-containing protein [Testicularia cyperi]|uniref:Tim17-domain-containing protein n=1 Tax=Testicularia cyperi TaxID=1882483 RepID=A0A317XJC8_9BASI|nr:Tim17-domain-containing protein [Testicularia cyperi]PWY98171.1 Tim17-domain-containing protein [Testicularia cyperi]